MRSAVVLLIVAIFVTATAPGVQAQWRYQSCAPGQWSVLEVSELDQRGFEVIRERMQQAVQKVLKGTNRTVEVAITNCPVVGYREVALDILEEQFAVIGTSSVRPGRWYKLFFTLRLLEDIHHEEVVQRAITQACIIRTGIFDDRLTPWTDETDVDIIRCRIQTAEAMGETEVVRWLSRYLRE